MLMLILSPICLMMRQTMLSYFYARYPKILVLITLVICSLRRWLISKYLSRIISLSFSNWKNLPEAGLKTDLHCAAYF
uniref:Uncharacterized protein n=1 Tax=Arundo donax TaxID=35708 RepID=A0A0A9CUP7_ARUDO